MVFTGNRRAEQREDAVSHRLRDIAFIAMHGFHHEQQRRVDNCARFFRVEILDEIHRVLDIGEQRGDGFPFSIIGPARLHRRLLGEDTFGEVRWRVRAGITSAGLRDAVVAEWGSTFATEFRMG